MPPRLVFVTVWVVPSVAAAKSNMAEKALGSLDDQPSVRLAGLLMPAFPDDVWGTASLANMAVLWLYSARQKEDENYAMWTRSLFFFVLPAWQTGSKLAWGEKSAVCQKQCS